MKKIKLKESDLTKIVRRIVKEQKKSRKITVTESELIDSIERIIKEQSAMLGFGNMGGLSLGVAKPTDKYRDLRQEDHDNTDNVSLTIQPGSNDEDSWMDEDYDMEEDIAGLVRDELKEAQAKEAKKWIQGAIKRPGALRKKLGVKKGDKISLEKINQEMRKLKSKDTNKKKPGVQGLTKANARTYRQLNLAKTLRGLSKKKHAKESTKWVKK